MGEPAAPFADAVQVPTAPVTLHASHAPGQAELQQTPSTQLPVWHCALFEQAVPLPRSGTQVVPLQYEVAAQSAFVAHVVGQLVPPAQV